MTIQYLILFTVGISHAYYSSGCQDFEFFFPSDTVQLLRNGKLIAKIIGGTLKVLFEADQAGEVLIPLEGRTLRVGLKLCNQFFSNITDLSSMNKTSTHLYRNATNPAVLDAPKETVLVGQVFSHSIISTARPLTVTLKNASGRALHTDTITAAFERTTISYDVTQLNAGVYTVEESAGGVDKTFDYYSDVELQQYGVFGIAEIEIDRSFYASAPAFMIPFNARQETLKYYIVSKNYSNAELNHLTVSDKGSAEDGRPKVNFTKVLPAAFTAEDISPALLGGSDVKVVLFKSQTMVPRRERARKNIELSKNGDVLVKHLPQPGADKTSGNLIVHISKP